MNNEGYFCYECRNFAKCFLLDGKSITETACEDFVEIVPAAPAEQEA